MRVVVADEQVWPWLAQDPGLGAAGIELVDATTAPETEVLDELAVADAYVGIWFSASCVRAIGRRFRFLQISAAGVDHVPLGELPDQVIVANAHGHGRSIAEHVLMSVLAVRRRLLWRDRELRAGRWRSRLVDAESPGFSTVADDTLGIVGYGHIGRSVAELAGAVGMRVVAATHSGGRPAPRDDLAWLASLDYVDQLFTESDVVVLACPLTDQTRALTTPARLAALGREGILVNVARGAVVDESALWSALEGGQIGGAALDVWDVPAGAHPVARFPFHERDDVLMTPHFSASADDTYRERAREVAANLVAVAGGGRPASQVNAR